MRYAASASSRLPKTRSVPPRFVPGCLKIVFHGDGSLEGLPRVGKLARVEIGAAELETIEVVFRIQPRSFLVFGDSIVPLLEISVYFSEREVRQRLTAVRLYRFPSRA